MDGVFLACGCAAVIFAFLAVLQRSLYASAICLMAVLLQTAALYYLMGARLLGLLQALIYAGAVMVLLVLAVTSAPPRLERLWAQWSLPRWAVSTALALPLAEFLAWARWADAAAPFAPAPPALELGMARCLFGPYALMTETLGVLLLVAALSVPRPR